MYVFISTRSYLANTGQLEFRFDFECAECGARAPTMVRTVGFGSWTSDLGVEGGEHWARHEASNAARRNAEHAMSTVPCPRCGKLASSMSAQIEGVRARVERRRRLRFPLAALAGAATLLVAMVPAVHDWHESRAAFFGAVAAAVLTSSLVIFALGWPLQAPSLVRRDPVWIGSGEAGAAPTWTPAPAVPHVAPLPRSRVSRWLSGITAFAAFSVAVIAFVQWRDSFLTVWVVDPENSGAVSVEIDGNNVGGVPASSAADVSFAAFTVRRGREHRLVLGDSSGARRTVALDTGDHKRGWVVAPAAADHDLCFVESEVVYAAWGTTRPPEASMLAARPGDDATPVTKDIDYAFEDPPRTMDTKESEVRKRMLRGYVCSALARSERVPYRARSAGAPSGRP